MIVAMRDQPPDRAWYITPTAFVRWMPLNPAMHRPPFHSGKHFCLSTPETAEQRWAAHQFRFPHPCQNPNKTRGGIAPGISIPVSA